MGAGLGADSGLHSWTGCVITKQDPGNRCLKAPRSRVSDNKNFKVNSFFAVSNDGNKPKFNLSIGHHTDMLLLWPLWHDLCHELCRNKIQLHIGLLIMPFVTIRYNRITVYPKPLLRLINYSKGWKHFLRMRLKTREFKIHCIHQTPSQISPHCLY